MGSPRITCTRRLQFCAGHRVMGHESKCAHLHGHNYVVYLEAEMEEDAGKPLDGIGRVIDFSVIKERIGGWIERAWDHGMVLWSGDSNAVAAMEAFRTREIGEGIDERARRQKVFLLPTNPTAENMADFLLRDVGPRTLDGTGVRLIRVTLHETENCHATVELER